MELSERTIGRVFCNSPWRRAIAMALGILAVGIDLQSRGYHHPLIAIIVLVSLGFLSRWDCEGIGLRLRPQQPLSYWLRTAAALGSVVVGFAIAIYVGARILGYPVPVLCLDPFDMAHLAFAFEGVCVAPP